MKIRKTHQKKRGAALVEYGLLIAGVALVSAAAISVFGHKVGGVVGAAAVALPGTSADDVGAFDTGQVVQTKNNGGVIDIDWDAAQDPTQNTLDELLGDGAGTSVNGGGTGGGN